MAMSEHAILPGYHGAEVLIINSMLENIMRGSKFIAYAIDKEYSYASYLNWRKPAPPRRIESLPKQQTAVLFTRAVISHLM
jgi:hypothetical protein